MQTSDASVSEELVSHNNRIKDDAKGLNMNEIPLPPPPIDNNKPSYILKNKNLQGRPPLKINLLKRRGRKILPS